MTKDEVISYIKQKKDIEHEISGIYKHKKYSWVEPSGLNVFTCLFFENVKGKENNFVVSSGAGDRSPESHFLKTHNKYYHPNELTPEKIDQIIAEDIPELYKLTMKDVTDYLESNKIKSLNEDFE